MFIRFPTSFLTKSSTSMTFFRQRQTCKIVENPSKYKGFRIVALFGMKSIRGSRSCAFRLKQTPFFIYFGIQKLIKSGSNISLDFLTFLAQFGLDFGAQMPPMTPQKPPKASQRAPKTSPRRPKSRPRRPKGRPRLPKGRPRHPKGASEVIFGDISMN